MRAIERIQRINNTIEGISVFLEVTDYVLHGQIRRGLARSRQRYEQERMERLLRDKQPATIKVQSERRPIRGTEDLS